VPCISLETDVEDDASKCDGGAYVGSGDVKCESGDFDRSVRFLEGSVVLRDGVCALESCRRFC